ncbi:apolipoprotein N-acyltransferase [Utexia brackfieldae]|uniref:apolipoprotein N-acyltransferase n=1 Tax=Utexia brackfieldae TaxID=3074108 RepID=UPI00370DA8E0
MKLKALLALFFGVIAVFAFSPFNLWPLAFFSFIGLVALSINVNAKKSAIIAFFWGLGFFGAGVHWIYVSIQQYGELPIPVALLLLSLLIGYLSLYPALFAFLLNRLAKPYSFVQLVIAAPALWQLTEFLRGWILSGFSWLQLGYTQLNSPLKAYLPIFGVNFLNLFVPMLCGLLLYLFSIRHRIHRLTIYLVVVSILVFSVITGYLSPIHWTKVDTSRKVELALVQGNIQQSLKWNKDQLETTLSTYKQLTQAHLSSADIIIWPEAAITDAELNQQDYLTALDKQARENKTTVATGIIDVRYRHHDIDVFNSIIVLGDRVPYAYLNDNRYSKHHLVPFGEYIPLAQLFKPIAQLLNVPVSSMTAGERTQPPLMMQGFKFTTVICYEIILPELILDNFQPDTDFLLTISNDAWFGNTIGPWQHLQMAQTRAVEFGRSLIRSTNNGITAVINPQGEIIDQLPQFEQAVLSVSVSPSIGETPFAIWGNWPYWSLTLLLFLITFWFKIRK